MILSLKVLNEDDGKTLTAGQALGRYLAYALAVVPFFLGILWIAFDKKNKVGTIDWQEQLWLEIKNQEKI